MTQTKLASFVEASANTMSGFVLSYGLQETITWYLDLPITHSHNLLITLAFTVLSLVRSYFWRRYFNKLIHKNNKKEINNDQTIQTAFSGNNT